MFTPERLFEIAVVAETKINALTEWRQLGIPDGFFELLRLEKQAMNAALWMEANGYKELPHVGCFHDTPLPKKGVRVIVRKGSDICSTGARCRKQAGRDYVVTVHDVHDGWISDPTFSNTGEIEVRQAKVEWVGAGGYWCWTDVANVEIVETPARKPLPFDGKVSEKMAAELRADV